VSDARKLSTVPDWLIGIVVTPRDDGRLSLVCSECGELLCLVEIGDSLWVFADVARDHRKFREHADEQPRKAGAR